MGGKETSFISATKGIRAISKPCRVGHLQAVQSVLPAASEQVAFNQGLQVLVYETLRLEGPMRAAGRSSAVLWNLVLISK